MRLLEELKKFNLDDLMPCNTVEKMSVQDQRDLAEFMGVIAEVVDMVALLPEEKGEENREWSVTMALVYGFIMGHNWVKRNWVLW